MSNTYHKVDSISREKNILANIKKLLHSLGKWQSSFTIESHESEQEYTIILKERRNNTQLREFRHVILCISQNPCYYSIKFFKTNKKDQQAKPIYSIKVEGNNNLDTIKRDMIKILEGNFENHFPTYYPI